MYMEVELHSIYEYNIFDRKELRLSAKALDFLINGFWSGK